MGVFGFTNEDAYDGLLQSAANLYGVDWNFLKAIVAAESGFNAQAIRHELSHTPPDASYGLMQILGATAKGLGFSGDPTLLFDPATNVNYGALYVGKQWARYGGDPGSVAASYNAGTAYKNTDGLFTTKGGNPSVNDYVSKVLNYYAGYSAAAGNPPPDAAGGPAVADATGGETSSALPDAGALSVAVGSAELEASSVWDSLTGAVSSVLGTGDTGDDSSSWVSWLPWALAGAVGVYFLTEALG
jgi:Transglycosylase SLT domain